MRKIIVFVLSGFVLFFPLISLAAVFQNGEESFSLDEPVADDLYVAGNTIEIGQQVTGDLFTAGQNISITAPVTEDVYAAGNTITLASDVQDDAHAAGANVTLSGDVAGDMFIGSGSATIEESATVGKDLYAGAGQLTIAGTIGGNVWAGSENVTLASGAVINGNLQVMGSKEPVIEEGATVRGEVKFVPTERRPERELGRGFLLTNWVRSVLSLFVLSLVMVYGVRAFSRRVAEAVKAQGGKSILTGAVWAILFIPVSIMLLITIVGIPLAAGVVVLTVLACLAANGIAAAGLGRWVLGKLSKDSGTELTWVHALIGAVIYEGVQLVPLIGWLAAFILVLFFFGATVLTLFKLLRNYEPGSSSTDTHQNTGTGVGAA